MGLDFFLAHPLLWIVIYVVLWLLAGAVAIGGPVLAVVYVVRRVRRLGRRRTALDALPPLTRPTAGGGDQQ